MASVLTRTLLETKQVVPEFLQMYIPEGPLADKPKFETESDFDPNDLGMPPAVGGDDLNEDAAVYSGDGEGANGWGGGAGVDTTNTSWGNTGDGGGAGGGADRNQDQSHADGWGAGGSAPTNAVASW